MTKSQKAQYISQRLAELYPNPKPPLTHTDHYTLLIAVLLSAQCTDKRVNQITPLLFAKAKNPEEMIKLGQKEILKIVRPCGLPQQKSSAIYNLSKILVDKYNSNVPNTFEDLESLPGVGHKTASVVMSQAFGIAAFPVDTHIHRLAKRWKLSSGKSVTQTERDLKKIFPEKLWNKLHLQIIFYAREYCTAYNCDGKTCEICSTVNNCTKPQ
jgi:endonuclease-3